MRNMYAPDFTAKEIYVVLEDENIAALTGVGGKINTGFEDNWYGDLYPSFPVYAELVFDLRRKEYKIYKGASLAEVVEKTRKYMYKVEEEAEIAAVRAKYAEKRKL